MLASGQGVSAFSVDPTVGGPRYVYGRHTPQQPGEDDSGAERGVARHPGGGALMLSKQFVFSA